MTDPATRRSFLRLTASSASGAFALFLLPARAVAAGISPVGTVRLTDA